MATPHRKGSPQHWIVRFLPLETLKQAENLAIRFQEVEGFRLYVVERKRLVIPAVLFIVLIGVACAAGTVVFLAGAHGLLTLLALLLAPLILIGSLFVQMYVFFSWLENRSLALALGHRTKPAKGTVAAWLSRKLDADMGTFPPVPWILATVFLVAPLAMLAYFAFNVAMVLVVLAILAPIVYARFDR
ncbi:MAG TPA: hypothetical protein VJT81_06070 [Burkholderiales bacterium]|nr:hypothetical protein [Burkholderiales bacterium]